MHNVFLLYMPPGNAEAMVHYQDTIQQKVDIQRLAKFIDQNLRARLLSIFGLKRIAVWGSQAGERNRSNYERMRDGDDVLIVEGGTVRFIGKIAAKTENPALSRELWKPLRGGVDKPWQLIYFIANPRELDVPFDKFCRLFGYEDGYRLRGFTTISSDRLETFYAQYDDLYSILVRLQEGKAVAKRKQLPAAEPAAAAQDVPAESDAALVSDHVKMQWTLARLGRKAKERVWVPAGDQQKLRKVYQFDDFDQEFQAGLDLPHSYIENIDVVWKQEFRIGAAYEIENSTSIYSGLLRFADLNILAPNTIYPMFVVAPADRKNRLREQLRRPTFKRLELDKKVRFLSYEAVNEIDTFFATNDAGVTIDVVLGKSELVA
jgi:hypothetical protein